MASAAEPIWRTGAVGYEPSRLVGRARGRDFADQHDRRCDQPVVRAICGQRLHRGEHEPAGTLPEEAQEATGVLHRQSGDLSDRGENETGRQSIGEEPGRIAPNANRPRSRRVGNRLDSDAQPAGQRAGGAGILDGAGPVGEGTAGGWSDNLWREPTTTWKPSFCRGSMRRSRWCPPIPTMLTGRWRSITTWPRFSAT